MLTSSTVFNHFPVDSWFMQHVRPNSWKYTQKFSKCARLVLVLELDRKLKCLDRYLEGLDRKLESHDGELECLDRKVRMSQAGSGCHGWAPWEPLEPSPSPRYSRGWCRTLALSETQHVSNVLLYVNIGPYYSTIGVKCTGCSLCDDKPSQPLTNDCHQHHHWPSSESPLTITFDALKTHINSRLSGSKPSTSCSPHGPLFVGHHYFDHNHHYHHHYHYHSKIIIIPTRYKHHNYASLQKPPRIKWN